MIEDISGGEYGRSLRRVLVDEGTEGKNVVAVGDVQSCCYNETEMLTSNRMGQPLRTTLGTSPVMDHTPEALLLPSIVRLCKENRCPKRETKGCILLRWNIDR
jgi:hypothetical protein